MATIYWVDGRVKKLGKERFEAFRDHDRRLVRGKLGNHQLHKNLGGTISFNDMPSGMVMLCNDEGILLDLPVNCEASKHFKIFPPLVGNVVECKPSELW
jgi:hypothetical protein